MDISALGLGTFTLNIEPLYSMVRRKPTRCNNNFLFIDKSNLDRHVSVNNFAHLQELLTVQYSLWCFVPNKLPVGDLVMDPLPGHRSATYWVQHAISCIAQPKAPEDGQNFSPKHVELN